MNSFSRKHRPAPRVPARRRAALTLIEMMVAMGVFSIVTLGLVYTHLFALMQDQLANSKLGASDASRRGFVQLGDDVRSSKSWQVGNGDHDGFTPIANGTAQQGTALLINRTTDTNFYILYYFDTAHNELRRRQSGGGHAVLIAANLTNTMFFRAENYRGDVQADLTHKGVINVVMQFCQYQYPLTRVGPGYYFDYYKIQFKLTSHVPDGP